MTDFVEWLRNEEELSLDGTSGRSNLHKHSALHKYSRWCHMQMVNGLQTSQEQIAQDMQHFLCI